MGLLPLTAELVNTASGTEYAAQLKYITSDQDYEIIEVSAAPDATAVASGTFYVLIAQCNGGSDTTAQHALKTYTSMPAITVLGHIKQGFLWDPDDPEGLGWYGVALKANVALNVKWPFPQDRPTVERGDILAVLVLNSSPANAGVVVVNITGKPITNLNALRSRT